MHRCTATVFPLKFVGSVEETSQNMSNWMGQKHHFQLVTLHITRLIIIKKCECIFVGKHVFFCWRLPRSSLNLGLFYLATNHKDRVTPPPTQNEFTPQAHERVNQLWTERIIEKMPPGFQTLIRESPWDPMVKNRWIQLPNLLPWTLQDLQDFVGLKRSFQRSELLDLYSWTLRKYRKVKNPTKIKWWMMMNVFSPTFFWVAIYNSYYICYYMVTWKYMERNAERHFQDGKSWQQNP